MELTDGESGQPTVTRRSWLTAVGASVAIAAGATGTGSADEHGYGNAGYGTGPYGGQDETTAPETVLGVTTVGASEVGATSATLVGDVTELQGMEQAIVYFEYGPSGGSLSETTPEQTVSSTGEFTATASGLASDTEYSIRAVGRGDDEVVTGETATFATEQPTEPVPTIESLTAVDVSSGRNPHIDAELAWSAATDDGELYAAVLTLSDPDGVLDTWEYDLGGQSVERTELDQIPLGARDDTEYTVDLIVYNYNGEYETATTTFSSQ